MRNKQLCMLYILYENKTEATTQKCIYKKGERSKNTYKNKTSRSKTMKRRRIFFF